ncbi:hypothetical protein WJX72_006649 [[Myrmecia] bisecta]|uniref:PPIase cyclophilin-type domain-containing protein n=1 Tax=[Myrmecia] bisecta TaxID=41462 RepID=A0AAW1Q740_9CHLO
MRQVQSTIEDIAFKLRIPQRKAWGSMQSDVDAATKLMQQPDKVLYGVQPKDMAQGQQLVKAIVEELRRVGAAIDARDPDKTAQRVGVTLHDVAELELLQAAGISFAIPKEYANLPRLTGRAVAEVVIERPDGSLSFVDNAGGGLQAQAKLELVLDGYSAPISAGNFVVNLMQGMYDGRPLNVSYASILAGAGAAPGKTIPLENLPAGQFDPVYRLPLEVQAGELPVLPLSIFGAVAMAHTADPEDGLAAGDEFFIYKFDRQNLGGLSGLAFDEGKFGVFGYVTKGAELISQLQPGDVIVSAKLLSGQDRLVLPQSN